MSMSEPAEETGAANVWVGKPGQGQHIEQNVSSLPTVAITPGHQVVAIPPPADGYAVYLFPAAVEALGGIIAPYLQHEGGEPRLLCREVDTGGALIELTVMLPNEEGGEMEVELMMPGNMVRMIVSVKHDGRFGFGRKAEVALL